MHTYYVIKNVFCWYQMNEGGSKHLHVVWSVATVAQFVGNPMGRMQQHVLVEKRGSLDLHLEGPTCDSAYQHLFSLEADDVYW
jgi:hypothetical protein